MSISPIRAIAPQSNPGRGPLRVALFSGNYNYVRDGANQALNRLVGFLETQGIDVRVYSPTAPSAAFEATGTLVSVPSFPIPGRGEYRVAVGLPPAARRDLREFAPDVVHLSAPDLLGIRAQAFARRHGIPVVTSLHTRFETYLQFYGMAPLRRLVERYLHRFYRRSDLVMVPTPPMLDEFRQAGLASRTRLWSRGVDRDAFSPDLRDLGWRRAHGIADAETVPLFFGRLVREKGLAQFADVVDRVAGDGRRVRPLIVGDGPERDWLSRRLPSAVFTGHLMGAELGRAVASADLFVNPSRTEAFGNVTLEAMASGLPTVCADVPSGRALLADGRTGLFFDPDDTAAAVRAATFLIEAPERRAAMGRQARAASERFGWNAASRMMLDGYYEALAPRRQAALPRRPTPARMLDCASG